MTKTVSIRIKGDKPLVQKTLEQLKKIYPMSMESKLYDNAENNGCHVFLTVAFLEAVPA